MSKGSRRKAGIVLGFDALEERALLSHFSGAMAPGWGRTPGTDGAAPTSAAVMSSDSPGPCNGPPQSSAQDPPLLNAGEPPRDSAPPPGGPPPSASTASPFDPAGPASSGPAPGGGSSTLPATAPASVPANQAAFSSALSRQSETAMGPTSAHMTRAAASDEAALAGATGSEQAAASAPAAADSQIGGVPAAGTSGMGRSVLVSLGLTLSAIALPPPIGSPADPLPLEPEPAPTPVGASGDALAQDRSAGAAATDLPAPRGADLITDIAGFRQAPIEECLTRLFDQFNGTDETASNQAQRYPYVLPIAAVVMALEVARRWRRRVTKAPRFSRRPRNFVLNGIL